jgi:hypothetical protein
MNKIVGGVVCLLVLVAFIPTMTARASTTERDWIIPGQDYSVAGYSVIFNEWLKVSAFDNITINWKAGSSSLHFNIYVFTSVMAVNYSNFTESVNAWQPQYDCIGYYQYVMDCYGNSPQSGWITPSGYGIWQVKVDAYVGTLSQQTINITINPDPNNPNARIDNLTSQISTINDIIYNMTTNTSKIIKEISDIYADIYNMSAWEAGDIGDVKTEINQVDTSLTQMIENLNALSAENDSMLTKNIDTMVTNLTQVMDNLNTTLNTKISEIQPYNDTSVKSELDNLSKVQPVVEINNTTVHNETLLTLVNQTVVNQTLVNSSPVTHTYTNKTISLSTDSGNAVGAAIVAGVISGVLSSVIINGMRENRKKLREIPPPEP